VFFFFFFHSPVIAKETVRVDRQHKPDGIQKDVNDSGMCCEEQRSIVAQQGSGIGFVLRLAK